MSKELDNIRQEIDSLDEQLLQLFLRRMEASEKVAKIKQQKNLPLFQAEREDQILHKVASSAPPAISGYATAFFQCLMEQSKQRQRDFFRTPNEETPFGLAVRSQVDELEQPRVLVQGRQGSYSAAAAQLLYPGCQLSFVNEWEDVLYGIQDGTADYGVLPVENSSAGSVFEVYDLMLKYKFYIVKALAYYVEHCLLGVRGAKLSDIRDVYSHPHAFPQCTGFFEQNHRLHKHPYANTAMAAEYVALQGDKTKAAIASRENAHLYGLDILEENIQQTKSNCTRFLSVSKRPEFHENANKISVVFTLPHVTGSLCRTLTRFSNAGLNLTKIESRPNPVHNFEYYFYLDFTGSIRSENARTLLSALSQELPNFYFYGNYEEN